MHPILIVGVLLAGLPILLHLIMRQEPKRLLFPAIRFLQQKQRVNQRKMRLRHLLVLLMRMLLIALFALVLFQPKIPSEGLNLGGDQPVAVVFIIDRTPSMGLTAETKSRLDEARRRALELLDDLPTGSRVAVLDPSDPVGTWEPSIAEARRRLEAWKDPSGGGPPTSASLPTAYQLFRTLDEESEGNDKLPRLVAIFSDRTPASWDTARAEDLKKAAEAVPPPAVAHLYFDVGIDKPADVAILSAELRPEVVPSGQPVTLVATLKATGPDIPAAVIRCKVDGAATPERKEIRLSAGTPVPVPFTFRDLKPGWHQVELTLDAPDALLADNIRYLTFRVGEPRKILTISDDPDDAIYWQLAHRTKGEFACDVSTPDKLPDLAGYEAVALLDVTDPTRPAPGGGTLWEKLRQYVDRGGKLLIMPGGLGQVNLASYDPGNDATQGLMPGKLTRLAPDTRTLPAPMGEKPGPDRRAGVNWALTDAALRHPMLRPFREWQQRGTVDFLRNPRKAWIYWVTEPVSPEAVVVSYDDADPPATPTPAVLEKRFPSGGAVLLLTTRMDSPWEPDRRWHNYWETAESSWAVVFPNLLVRYLAGDSADVSFQFTTGQAVAIPLPRGNAGKKLVFEGPGITGRDANPEVGDRQAELRLPPQRTLTSGNFVLKNEDRSWQTGFSLNPPAEEFDLGRIPTESIEAVTGADSVIPVGKDFRLRDAIQSRGNREFPLFPWLLLALLGLFVTEGFVANRFYRLRR